jgi:ankyrin repeat protein
MFKRLIVSLVCFTFIFSNLQYVHAQAGPATGGDFSVNQLPVPGTMVGVSAPFAPLSLKGLVVNPQKPLEFQFIVDTGKGPQDTASIKDQANQLVKYFLAGLTIPEGDLWVNLSPYEKDRMVPLALGQTDLGRDLLAQDYILKQLTASLIYPEKDLGKEFWSRVYAKAQKQFGTTNIPVNTFNKVWILPDQAQVFENRNAAYVTKSTLKVMLDEDYLALSKNECRGGPCDRPNIGPTQGRPLQNDVNSLGSQIVREIVIPEITKEVNTGKNFAPLRQIYQALILAKWYKETIQNGLLDAVYTNKNKTAGVNVNDPTVKEQIYNRYLQAYKKGAFNYIKEDPTPDGQAVPRKYFSGGITHLGDFAMSHDGKQSDVRIDGAMVAVKVDLKKPKDMEELYKKFIHAMTAHGGGGFWFETRGYKFVARKENVYDRDGKFIRKAEKPEWVDKDGNALTQKIVIKFLNQIWERLIKDECIVNGKVQMGRLRERLSLDFFGLDAKRKNKLDDILGNYYGILQRQKRDKDKDEAMRSDYLGADLLKASSNGDTEEVRRLLGLKANVNAKDQNDNTPLMFASEDGHLDIVNLLLLEEGVDINAKNKEGQTPLALAVLNGRKDVVKRLLLEKDIDVNAKLNEHWGETTILMMAVTKDYPDIVEMLLKKGANVNATDGDGKTAWFLALEYGRQKIGEILKAASESHPLRKIKTQIKDIYKNNGRKPLSFKDKAALAQPPGGIDLNQINVLRKGKTVNVQFDPAQLNELMQGGFEGFTPAIINITHISSPFQLLGINPAKQP